MPLSSLSVNEGDWIALKCSLHTLGDPYIIWRWMCGDDDLTINASYYSTQSTLNITADRKYNQKPCQCWATSPRSSLSYNRSSGAQAFTVFCKCLAYRDKIGGGGTHKLLYYTSGIGTWTWFRFLE